MTNKSNDTLLRVGELLALVLQGLCALAAGIVALIFVFVALVGIGLLSGFADNLPAPAMYPLPGSGLALSMFASLAALFFFFGHMRAIIRSVTEGDPFAAENARRLNAMAWLLLGHEVAAVLVGALRYHIASLMDQIGPEDAFFTFNPYEWDGLLMVILLFILARVFRHGAAMRADLEGTV